MNKKKSFTFVIVAVVFIVVGIILLIIGAVMHGFDKKYAFGNADIDYEVIEQNFDAREIQNLELELSVGKYIIKSADTDKISVVGKNVPKDTFDVGVSGTTFKLESHEKKWYNWGFISFGNIYKDTEFEITIPAKSYNEVDIDAGVGNFEMTRLYTNDFSIDGGVGETILNECQFDKADIDGGVGDITLNGCQLGETSIDVGVGEIDFQGKILGDTDISMGVGSAVFDIDGFRNDYKIKKDGMVKIEYDDNGSENTEKIDIDIDTGVGDIKLKFK